MSVLKHELIDEEGESIANLIDVDGTIIGSFGKDPSIIANNVRNVRELKLRDSDVMLCTAPKSVECNCWFEYVKGFEKGMEANEIPIHLAYYEDLKQDPVSEIKKIATFLGVAADDALCRAIAEQCDFKAMEERSPYKSMTGFMNKDGQIFRKGIIGDWKSHFTDAQNAAFDALYKTKMADSKLKFRFE